jgi:hypothetical protein
MKTLSKLTLNLILVIVFLLSCFFIITVGYTSVLLHTYNVFTEREPVAKVTISSLKSDENGKYADVSVRTYQFERSALTSALFSNVSSKTNLSDEINFKLYGDTIYIGGPIIKFKDELILLNFKTIFKLGKIYSRYELDNNLERTRNEKMTSSYDINNGFAEWKTLFDQYQKEGFMGDIIRSIIDSTQLSMAGQMIGSRDIQYTVYITNNGFLWKLE